jgi:thiosulfate sulfurtransferase
LIEERRKEVRSMEIPQIQIHDAKQKLDQKACVFVDIRDPGSYQSAHIPGAIHLHDGNVQEFLQNADKNQAVVVYCYHGNSSMGATGYLIENGFTNVASMSGGFEAWRQVYEHEST